jgi:hypothetical protein
MTSLQNVGADDLALEAALSSRKESARQHCWRRAFLSVRNTDGTPQSYATNAIVFGVTPTQISVQRGSQNATQCETYPNPNPVSCQ